MSYGIYDNILATAIHTFKFQKMRRLYKPLGRLLTGFDLTGIDAIIPVPLSLRGLRERGFNQSLLLAKVVSDNSCIPLLMNGLRKNIETPVQIGLSKKERAANLRGAFTATGSLTGMQLLLVDDVMTTGATVRECSKVLLEAGATDVVVVTLARASTL